MLKNPKDIIINGVSLQQILDEHKVWLQTNGTTGTRADLSNANLSNADLVYTNLFNANLSSSNLYKANLSYANLSYANLSYANLSNADLSNADLYSANLSYARFQIAGKRLTVNSNNTNFFQIKGSKHWGYRIDEYVKIGCEEHTLQYWLENVETIARNHNYSAKQVLEYKLLIELASKMF